MTRRLGSWGRPVEPWPTDSERWRRFCLEIDDRIAAARVWSPDRLYWRTFNPPIPPAVDGHPLLPTGRVVRGSTSATRAANGRFLKRGEG